MENTDKQNQLRIIFGSLLLILGFFSPLLSFYVQDLTLSNAMKTFIIGSLVFGIPELFMVIAIAIMGKKVWELIKIRIHGVLSFLSPQKVSKKRYYIGVTIFSLCLVEGILEIHSTFIQDWMADKHSLYQWIMNALFLLSFFIAGGEFWDKLRSIFIYTSD